MTELRVEVVKIRQSGQLSAAGKVIENFAARANEVADSVADVADQFRQRLAEREPTGAPDGAWHLSEVHLTFELALEAGSGVIIASGKAGATFSVDVLWRRDSAMKPD